MKIKFHETLYNLISMPNVMPTHFQATFEKGENTFDSIVTDTLNIEEITIYNDEDEISGVYTGFNSRVALYVLDGNEQISVEFENSDIRSQIEALTQQTASLDAGVSELAENVATLNETQDSQDAAIEELAEALT